MIKKLLCVTVTAMPHLDGLKIKSRQQALFLSSVCITHLKKKKKNSISQNVCHVQQFNVQHKRVPVMRCKVFGISTSKWCYAY